MFCFAMAMQYPKSTMQLDVFLQLCCIIGGLEMYNVKEMGRND